MKRQRNWIEAVALVVAAGLQVLHAEAPRVLYVDPGKGSDTGPGTAASPLQSLQGAVDRLPALVTEDIVISLAGGDYRKLGSRGAPLELNRPMRGGAKVRIAGDGGAVILNWGAPGAAMIAVSQGQWSLANVQVGSRLGTQAGGIRVTGPALLELRNVRVRTTSQAVPGLHATSGGMIHLFGKIELNEDLHEAAGAGESFCGVAADYSGVVRFGERENASLSIGNGSLSAKYYGVIELGCATARITCWHDQANVIAVNNSGRVDFHSTKAVLTARNPRNTPIGLEDDGHVLAEGAPITIQGCTNGHAIVLQKASTFFCNDVTLLGSFGLPLSAMSGSTMLVGIVGDLDGGEVSTGARIIVEKCTGRLTRAINVSGQAQLILPEGLSVPSGAASRPALAIPGNLPPLQEAAAKGNAGRIADLLAAGGDVNQRDELGRTALHWAAFMGHPGLCSSLLAKGANPQARDAEGRRPLDLARAAGHDQVTSLLMEQRQRE